VIEFLEISRDLNRFNLPYEVGIDPDNRLEETDSKVSDESAPRDDGKLPRNEFEFKFKYVSRESTPKEDGADFVRELLDIDMDVKADSRARVDGKLPAIPIPFRLIPDTAKLRHESPNQLLADLVAHIMGLPVSPQLHPFAANVVNDGMLVDAIRSHKGLQ